MARWLELLAEYDRRDGWWSWHGVRSLAEWVAWRCSISPRAAREHVRVARALRELPVIAEAFGRGELSYAKVRPLTRVATERTETDLIELARHATAAQLERMLRGYERVTREEANASDEERELWWHWDQDGSLVISGRLPAEDGMALLRALETSRSQIREEARVEREEYGLAEPRPAEPPRCRFPGCEMSRFVDAHHVRHWAHGGETSLDNLVLLCRHHHRLVHEGGFAVQREARGLVFRDARGEPVEPSPSLPPTDHESVRRGNRRAGIETFADTLLTGTGERLDLSLAVDALVAICDGDRPQS
jgi:hypothetical protein